MRFFRRIFQRESGEEDERPLFIIFDWDDTIFPTRYLVGKYGASVRYADLTEAERNQLRLIDDLTLDVLNRAAEEGNLSIVSNANLNWLKHTAREFLPLTSNFLFRQRNNVSVLSARDGYQWRYWSNMSMWKCLTFEFLYS